MALWRVWIEARVVQLSDESGAHVAWSRAAKPAGAVDVEADDYRSAMQKAVQIVAEERRLKKR